MSYGLENALDQWQHGERMLGEAPPGEEHDLERAVAAVLEELRRRLGSAFLVSELVELYAGGTDWADACAQRAAGASTTTAVDAAFHRYARQATDYAGGRRYVRFEH